MKLQNSDNPLKPFHKNEKFEKMTVKMLLPLKHHDT